MMARTARTVYDKVLKVAEEVVVDREGPELRAELSF